MTGTEQIRDKTRTVWDALLETGTPPSVRAVHRAVGGAWHTVAAECKLLRDAYHAGTPVPATRTLPEAVVTVAEAEAALATVHHDVERAVQAARQAETIHTQAEEAVRALERQMLAGALVQDALVAARRDRTEAYLRMGDMQALAQEAEAFVAPAEVALAEATRRAELAQYNALAGGRGQLLAAVEAAVAQLEAALQPLLKHHQLQLTQAEKLGFAALLKATPFNAGPPDAGNLTSYAVLNFWLHARLSALVPAPSHDIDRRLRLHIPDLGAVDKAFGHQLPWDQFMQATAPERPVQVRLAADPTTGASNLLALTPAGLPGVLSPLNPLMLPATAAALLQQHTHALQVLGDVGGE